MAMIIIKRQIEGFGEATLNCGVVLLELYSLYFGYCHLPD